MAVTAIDYEVTYVLRPSLEETEVDERANAIAEGVKTRGGEIVGELEKHGKRRLAYEIDDVREGYYVTMHFRSTGRGAEGARAAPAPQRERPAPHHHPQDGLGLGAPRPPVHSRG